MHNEFTEEHGPDRSRLLSLAVPLILLVVVVALISGLVLGRVLPAGEARTSPEGAPTTLPTVEVSP